MTHSVEILTKDAATYSKKAKQLSTILKRNSIVIIPVYVLSFTTHDKKSLR